ncbi:MAG: Rpn family recombination-promoting nuclease/putative transposase [Eubacterium sp.]|nr:Rpn family recombination-promoting nuclease/putative transposase [Eubacterium sp.]
MKTNQNGHSISNNQSHSAIYDIDTNFQNARGKIPYNMTNDYMFRAVLQSNNKVLRGLICSLLHLTESEISSVEIMNPIVLGKSIESKEFRLDINVLLNNNTLINLEMQVANRLNWHKRSVMYLCRSFDSLNHGQDYEEAKSAIHIGFMDYTLFADYLEFYATYKLINIKNHQIYNDSITLNVVNLSRIDLATEEDRQYHLDYWAALFKAATWEELKMLASKDEYLNEASKTIYRMSADEMIRKQCRDREEYYEDLRSYERAIAKRDQTIAEKDAQIKLLLAENEKLKMQAQGKGL